MIVSQTPLRMSFVGGGSDIPSYYSDEIMGGAVLSVAINKYIYVSVNNKFDGDIRVSYSRTENVNHVEEVKHPLVRESLKLFGINNSIEISSMADIPSKGSGLGSSSSFTVGLINALMAYTKRKYSKSYLAELACDIELNRCLEPIGKQDQYAAAFGGMNLIIFKQNNTIEVVPVKSTVDIINEFQESILVFYTGITRSSASVLQSQKNSFDNRNIYNRKLVRRMVELSYELKDCIESGVLNNVGDILNENWKLKCELSSNVSNKFFDDIYDRGIKSGAKGGKLLGAGNGGFFMFYAPFENHNNIINSLSFLKKIDVSFDYHGSRIVMES
jgi:D-glycero-alpha-D-manno-heptose-7-phosphate kinase